VLLSPDDASSHCDRPRDRSGLGLGRNAIFALAATVQMAVLGCGSSASDDLAVDAGGADSAYDSTHDAPHEGSADQGAEASHDAASAADRGAVDAPGASDAHDAGGTGAHDAGGLDAQDAAATDAADGGVTKGMDAGEADAGQADAHEAGVTMDAAGATDGPADAPFGTVDASDGGPPQAVGIPMYIDPGATASAWTQVTAAAPTVALLVANPNSGPDTVVRSQYTQAIATAHAASQTIVGYVHTSYGARALSQVEADIDAWYSFYPAIDGIFFDEASSDTTTISGYYSPLFTYVKGKGNAGHTVILNPGWMVDEAFMGVADIIVTFEDTYTKYTNGSYPTNPAWVANYPRWRFWHLVLSATSVAEMQNAVSIARQRNVGYVYVTDQAPATAYSQLVTGTYWQGELAAVVAP
jgi:hypothetical protein